MKKVLIQNYQKKILNRINSGNSCEAKIKVKDIPSRDNRSIINLAEENFTRDFDLIKLKLISNLLQTE